MINVTEIAESTLKEYFKDKEIKPIRVFLQSGGCGGPSLGMVLDDPTDADDVFTVNDFTLLIDKELHGQTGTVTVDYVTYSMGSGFKVDSETPITGTSSCGSTCGPSCGCSSGSGCGC